jgi:hypothetical protein
MSVNNILSDEQLNFAYPNKFIAPLASEIVASLQVGAGFYKRVNYGDIQANTVMRTLELDKSNFRLKVKSPSALNEKVMHSAVRINEYAGFYKKIIFKESATYLSAINSGVSALQQAQVMQKASQYEVFKEFEKMLYSNFGNSSQNEGLITNASVEATLTDTILNDSKLLLEFIVEKARVYRDLHGLTPSSPLRMYFSGAVISKIQAGFVSGTNSGLQGQLSSVGISSIFIPSYVNSEARIDIFSNTNISLIHGLTPAEIAPGCEIIESNIDTNKVLTFGVGYASSSVGKLSDNAVMSYIKPALKSDSEKTQVKPVFQEEVKTEFKKSK